MILQLLVDVVKNNIKNKYGLTSEGSLGVGGLSC